jgi:Raf kinase inhibitor-like YbhB/YbcL family protein
MTSNPPDPQIRKEPPASTLYLRSRAFENLGPIPREFTAEGGGYSPPLSWGNLPEAAQSLALIVVDPDIPSRQKRLSQFVHWVVYNLPAGVADLPANLGEAESARLGATIGRNGSGRRRYYPPCPVWGEHDYIFRLFALNIPHLQPRAADYGAVMKAIAGHVLSSAELVGVYRRATLSAWQALLKNTQLGS